MAGRPRESRDSGGFRTLKDFPPAVTAKWIPSMQLVPGSSAESADGDSYLAGRSLLEESLVNTQSRIAALLVSATFSAFALPGHAGQAVVTGSAPVASYQLAAAEMGSAPQIIVTETRGNQDLLITRGVVNALSQDARLAGRIGVETLDGDVELTGIVTTAGQSRQAERDAMSVSGVRHVHNELATRIGGGKY
jgi:BON domain-containing protein